MQPPMIQTASEKKMVEHMMKEMDRSAFTANPMAYGIANEIKITASTLTGDREVDVEFSNFTRTAYTNGNKIVIGVIRFDVKPFSKMYWWLKGKAYHEMFHCQNSSDLPHIYDIRKMPEWNMSGMLSNLHNITLDHSIEQYQNYPLYSGVYVAIREVRNIVTNEMIIPGVMKPDVPGWCRAVLYMDLKCRSTWMPDMQYPDMAKLLSLGDTSDCYDIIKDLEGKYLSRKSDNPDKDYELACEIEARFKQENKVPPPPPPEEGEGGDGEGGEGTSQEDEGDENEGKGKAQGEQQGEEAQEQGDGQEGGQGQKEQEVVLVMDNHEESIKQGDKEIEEQKFQDDMNNNGEPAEGYGYVHDVDPLRFHIKEIM